MKDEKINALYQKYLDGTLNATERKQWGNLVTDIQFEEAIYAGMDADYQGLVDENLLDLQGSRAQEILAEVLEYQTPVKKRLWIRYAAAAAIAVVIFTGGLFYYILDAKRDQTLQLSGQNDIAPGKNGATLTLSNGQKIFIKDVLTGNIASQSGVKILKTADGQITYEITNDNPGEIVYNTLSTTRGEQTQVRLPDGTLVFLNAESSLRYPTSFSKSHTREVSLTGEGYFEVSKDKSHPFVVKSAAQRVEVLGTHFNINSYHNENSVKTTLLEGAVKVNDKTLRPNEQSVLTNGQIKINQVDVDNVVAWKNGIFLFEDESLSSIMRKIERWYDVEVVFEGGVDQNKTYGGGVSRYGEVSKVLEKLTMTGHIHFKIEGRRITVMK